MKCEASLTHKSSWLGKVIAPCVFPRGPHCPWNRNAQKQPLTRTVCVVTLRLTPRCFSDISVQPVPYLAALWEERADGLEWPLPVILHKSYGSFKLSGWEIQLSAEGYCLVSTQSLSWTTNSNHSDTSVTVYFGIYTVMTCLFIFTSNLSGRELGHFWKNYRMENSFGCTGNIRD